MESFEAAKQILKDLGFPTAQQSDLCAYSLLAIANLKDGQEWNTATNKWIRIHDIIDYIKEQYGVSYAENSRETFRKKAMHHFRTAAIIEDNDKATNSPNYCYRLTAECLACLQNYNGPYWDETLKAFLSGHPTLIDIYTSKKRMTMFPINVNGHSITFSSGTHNLLQKAIIEDFAPRFAPNCVCLYVGDTIKKDIVNDTNELTALGFQITQHDKMPDVILYIAEKDWLYFIESVTSVGPMDPKRLLEISNMTNGVKSGKIYITAFPDRDTFKKFSSALAWETEVWIANEPEHMIHMNGDKFLGPRT